MRIRTIKPGTFVSLTLAALPITTRLHFIGLWCYADDEGRGLDDPRLLKAALWPLDTKITPAVVERYQAELADADLIVRYQAEGRAYFQVTHWKEHQRVNRPQPSLIPPASFTEESVNAHGIVTEESVNAHGIVTEESVLEVEGKGSGRERKGIAPRERDALFDALAETTGRDPTGMTRREATACATALADIRRATPDLAPDEIRRRAANYRQHMPHATLTPSALANHWSLCAASPRDRTADAAADVIRERYGEAAG
jgi:hypothetical protein